MFKIALHPTHFTAKRGAFEDNVKLTTSFGLLFGEGSPFNGAQIIPKLEKLRNNVEEAASTVWAAANP